MDNVSFSLYHEHIQTQKQMEKDNPRHNQLTKAAE